ncbi:MAG: conjugative transfer signal peptidase TraF [Thermoanaerobaculia bacterium]|nr:conjugative transfer signal peptidase TraF [Thermoanaerobaculia bacterium]
MVARRLILRPLRLAPLVGLALATAAIWLSCFRLNLSPSLPSGLYFLVPAFFSRPLERGDLALACPPAGVAAVAHARDYSGFGLCPGFVPEILKPVGALPGDRVAVRNGFVWIDGARAPAALVLDHDSLGRPLTPFSLLESEVPADSIFLLSTHSPRSWDSRNYGPVPFVAIRARAVPLWRFGR